MDIVEYLLFVPLLIYGIALSDLFIQWKRFLEPSAWHIPYLLTIIIITDIGVNNVFEFHKLSPQLKNITYFTYWLYILPPLLYLMLVNILTNTNESIDMETFFSSKIRIVFLLLAFFIAMHFIPQFRYDQTILLPRLLGIIGCILYAFWHKKVFFYFIVAIWVLAIVKRAYAIYAL
jgi:hypothetical protein